MGFLGNLFGKSSTSSSKGGRISMAAMTIQNHKLSPQQCGVDNRTFPCPSITHTLVTGDINRFALDIGGYCSQCREFRCHQHVEFKQMEPMTFGIFCTVCGGRVSGVTA